MYVQEYNFKEVLEISVLDALPTIVLIDQPFNLGWFRTIDDPIPDLTEHDIKSSSHQVRCAKL